MTDTKNTKKQEKKQEKKQDILNAYNSLIQNVKNESENFKRFVASALYILLNSGTRLTVDGLRERLKEQAKKAGIDWKDCKRGVNLKLQAVDILIKHKKTVLAKHKKTEESLYDWLIAGKYTRTAIFSLDESKKAGARHNVKTDGASKQDASKQDESAQDESAQDESAQDGFNPLQIFNTLKNLTQEQRRGLENLMRDKGYFFEFHKSAQASKTQAVAY